MDKILIKIIQVDSEEFKNFHPKTYSAFTERVQKIGYKDVIYIPATKAGLAQKAYFIQTFLWLCIHVLEANAQHITPVCIEENTTFFDCLDARLVRTIREHCVFIDMSEFNEQEAQFNLSSQHYVN